ncbi:MAG: MotA/TolQ/ExbB proton channel family protein [Planctomycetota bacterium]|jgi:biopolymer transport protein ExbB|nr:MotA/TolQ/ExbB proton channel family protein [Planctomycetota bacterium]
MPQRMAVRQKQCAALVAVGMIFCAVTPVWAQRTRAWAGTDATVAEPSARDEMRLAATPAATPLPPNSPPVVAEYAPSIEPVGIASGSLLATLLGGGVLMVPLIGCSFALVVFGIERAVSLRTGRVAPRMFVDRFIEQLQAGDFSRQQALVACDSSGSPVARVFAAAVRRWGRPAVEIEQAAIDACEREIVHLRRYRRVFNGVSTIAPLLGLLGTVFGLIRSFNDVAAAGAMGRPDMLAGGFGEALITTAMGLLVAIPAMVLHSFFTSRVDRLALRLDETCQQVIDEIALETVGEGRRRAAA